MVREGSPQSLAQAIVAYAELGRATVPQPCTVVIAHSISGFFALRFPEQVPAYSFVNLIGWLNSPPGIAEVSSAMGWYTSPATGIKYALYPDPANGWGDTLIGYNDQGRAVSVYLPDGSLCEISQHVKIYQEPILLPIELEEQGRVTVTFNADPSFGNFNFVVTHSKDHKW